MNRLIARCAVGLLFAVAFNQPAQASEKGDTCRFAMAQLLYRPVQDFSVVSSDGLATTIAFKSSYDGEARQIDCEIRDTQLVWKIDDSEGWHRWRDQPADDQFAVSPSGFVTAARSSFRLEKRRSPPDITPYGTTYLVKLLLSDDVKEPLALALVNTLVLTLDATGGDKNQAHHCAFYAGQLLKDGSMNYEVLKLDIEECFPGAVGAIASGAGLTQEQIIQAMLTNALESETSFWQFQLVYDLRINAIRRPVYADYFQFKDKVDF